MIKILFFDFDGTVDDALNLQYNTLVKVIQKHDYHADKNKIRALLGLKMQNIIKGLGISADVNLLRREFYKELNKGLNKLKLCVSVRPLQKLKKEYKLVVISNAESSFVKASLKKLKISHLFERVYSAEKFSTKDKALKKLFKAYRIKPKEAVYIGDRFTDVICAKKAGCYAIAIHNKCAYSTLSQVKKQKPDFVIKDFYGLKKVLEKIDNKSL